MTTAHALLLALINIVWGANVVATKETVTAFSPLTSVALRYTLVLLFCLPFIRIVPGRMGLVLLTGFLAGAVQFGIVAYGYSIAHNVPALAIAGQMGVPIGLVLAVLIDGERIHWRRTLGILLAFGGIAVLMFDPRIMDERLALLCVGLGALMWAITNMLIRRLSGISVLNLYAWQALVSVPALLLAVLLFEPRGLAAMKAAPASAWMWVAYSAFLSSIVGHAGMAWLIQRHPVSRITPYTLPTPLIAVIISSLVYRIPITPVMVLGGAMTLAGITIITLRTVGKARYANR